MGADRMWIESVDGGGGGSEREAAGSNVRTEGWAHVDRRGRRRWQDDNTTPGGGREKDERLKRETERRMPLTSHRWLPEQQLPVLAGPITTDRPYGFIMRRVHKQNPSTHTHKH